MGKLLVVGILGLFLISCMSVIINEIDKEGSVRLEEKYQGPVPIGYDLKNFRETGNTIKEKIDG